MKRTLAILLSAAAAACSKPAPPAGPDAAAVPKPIPGPVAAARPAPPPWIHLERMPCFGLCPTYTMEVDLAGKVTFVAVGYRLEREARPPPPTQLTPEELDKLRAVAASLGTLIKAKTFDEIRGGCGQVESSQYALELRQGNEALPRVESCKPAGLPEFVAALDRLEEITRAKALVEAVSKRQSEMFKRLIDRRSRSRDGQAPSGKP